MLKSFFQSLIKDNHLGSIHFDDVVKNMEKHRGQIQEEYDLVMTNGDAIGIVEVKYKAHANDLDKLDRKMKHFKKLFPILYFASDVAGLLFVRLARGHLEYKRLANAV